MNSHILEQLRCYEAVPSQVFGLLGAISSLTECVERCNMYMEQSGKMLVGATWFLEPNNNLQCHCAETKRWRQTRKQAYTCFFQGGKMISNQTCISFTSANRGWIYPETLSIKIYSSIDISHC